MSGNETHSTFDRIARELDELAARDPVETECAVAGWLRDRAALGNASGADDAQAPRAPVADRVLNAERAALAAERRQVERLRTDLLATVSHELRTPLTLIRTSIGLLLDSKPDAPMRERLLRNIKQSTDRMNALVADILDLARLRGDRAELQVRRVDLSELAHGAAGLMRPLLEAKGQRLTLQVERPAPAVLGDPRRLERVLINLLSNAHKFSPDGAHVHLSVVDEGPTVLITVSDSGPGISPAAMPHLFEQFYTDRTSSSHHNIGAGLGLPIAKGIVEAHGGHITVESAVGRGATFRVSLPKEPIWNGGSR